MAKGRLSAPRTRNPPGLLLGLSPYHSQHTHNLLLITISRRLQDTLSCNRKEWPHHHSDVVLQPCNNSRFIYIRTLLEAHTTRQFPPLSLRPKSVSKDPNHRRSLELLSPAQCLHRNYELLCCYLSFVGTDRGSSPNTRRG